MVAGIALGVYFPQATARLDVSASGLQVLSFRGAEADIGLVHIFLLNVSAP